MECSGSSGVRGHVRFSVEGRDTYAHRVALELKLGRRLGKTELSLHACDNPKCCRDTHLEVGTLFDNAQQAVARGRRRKPGSRYHRLSEADVIQIKLGLYLGHSVLSLSIRFRCGETTVRDIKARRTWTKVVFTKPGLAPYDPESDV